ncbi:uncharacterized protein LOC117112317 [Anneissia japonica]|uniref:uncharacterized protein LOC117112317 n=1 Tax=Anneissia japonica TaxID=1529436 RepID=UPI0014258DFF|nr:uncharacterized protein LOC117112317 [Anneissia japonica]
MKTIVDKTGIRNTTLLNHSDFTNCRKTFLLISFILTCATGDVMVEQEEIMAREGSSVTLKCIVTSDNTPTVSWFFNDNRIFHNQKVVEEDKIVLKYTFSNTTGLNSTRTYRYNLQIRNVLPTDDGVYTCRVIIAEKTITRHIKLEVKYLNENPFVSCQFSTSNTSIQHGSSHQTEKTRYQTQLITGISCTANIGKNIIVNITIMKSAHYKNDLIPVYFAITMQSDSVNGVNIIYPVNVTGLDGWQFWCVAHQSMILQPLNSSTPLLMKPRVKITKLNIDSEEQFKCEVESYPDASFRWIICEKETENVEVEECKVLNSTSSDVTLMDIGAVDDALILICEAQNAVGTGHGNLSITRHTGPPNLPITRQTEPTGTMITPTKNEVRGGLFKWFIGGAMLLIFCIVVLLLLIGQCLYKRFCKTAPADIPDDQYTSLKFDTNQRQHDYQELGKLFTTPLTNNCEVQYINIPSVNLKDDPTHT